MGEQFLFYYFLIPVGLWALLYISDYYLTLLGAQLYVTGANKHLQFGGSYELNPIFEKDIDALRRVNPRFIIYLIGSALFLLIARGLARDLPFLFVAAAGGFILVEVFVHLRHFRNIASFWYMRRDEGVTGKLDSERWYSMRLSAVDALAFSLFCGAAAVLLGSWFFAGGMFSCLGIGLRHWLASTRLRS